MERTLILKTIEKIGEKVRICGWVEKIPFGEWFEHGMNIC